MRSSRCTVIVSVYNEEKYIEQCLISLSKQKPKLLEIIAADDGSTDKSAEIIKSLQKKIPNLKYVYKPHIGYSAVRNEAALVAKGDILVFLDADMTFDQYFVNYLIIPILKDNEVASFSRSEYVANLDNVWAKNWDISTFNNNGQRITPGLGERGTTFKAISKKDFMRSGGFDNKGYRDDSSILSKLKTTSMSSDLAICYHFNPSSLKEVFLSARWMGRDTRNKGGWHMLLIFSPLWSLFRAVQRSVILKSWSYLLFKIVFDFGYEMGLIDINFRGVHYK